MRRNILPGPRSQRGGAARPPSREAARASRGMSRAIAAALPRQESAPCRSFSNVKTIAPRSTSSPIASSTTRGGAATRRIRPFPARRRARHLPSPLPRVPHPSAAGVGSAARTQSPRRARTRTLRRAVASRCCARSCVPPDSGPIARVESRRREFRRTVTRPLPFATPQRSRSAPARSWRSRLLATTSAAIARARPTAGSPRPASPGSSTIRRSRRPRRAGARRDRRVRRALRNRRRDGAPIVRVCENVFLRRYSRREARASRPSSSASLRGGVRPRRDARRSSRSSSRRVRRRRDRLRRRRPRRT